MVQKFFSPSYSFPHHVRAMWLVLLDDCGRS